MTGAKSGSSAEALNPKTILATYLDSLRAAGSQRAPVGAILLFYGAPLAVSVAAYLLTPANTQMNWSAQTLSVFSILLGLLINVQLSVFSIFNRFRNAARDEFRVEDEAEIGFGLTELKRMSSLISYLTLISVVAMAASIVLAVTSAPPITQQAVVLFFYAHFLLNALLLLKRGHVLFQRGFH